ncbi:MAG: helix-turn-helix domain-containing protein [Brevefilum sp.]|nr:helix-turn-helix domain-containing protein [Brevefilum sp.]
MSIKSSVIVKRIKSSRKFQDRSKKDCANILGLSADTYHSIETGETPITLPQLELLSIFLDINLSDLLQTEPPQPIYVTVFSEEIRPQYLTLRDKMIRAMLSLELKNHSLILEEVSQAIHIPLGDLQAYFSGEEPIPADNLFKISDYLGLSLDKLYEPIGLVEAQQVPPSVKASWQPEFTDEDIQEPPTEEDPYMDLLKAFRKLPIVDQAHIAKTILEKLKNA